jgi:acyl-CoA thioester hydrolase
MEPAPRKPSQASASLDLPVRYVETDGMGVVHHSNYLVWFEAARVHWMDVVGMPYAEIAAGGHHFAVTAAGVEYRAPARFGDTVRITASLALLRSRQVRFDYWVHNVASGALLATGHTEHICVDPAGRVARIPQAVMERMLLGVERLVQTRTGQLLVEG